MFRCIVVELNNSIRNHYYRMQKNMDSKDLQWKLNPGSPETICRIWMFHNESRATGTFRLCCVSLNKCSNIKNSAMANDREVLREIWEGKVPVCFQLDSEEVSELQAPDPFYLMVPRLSYFPLCTDKVRKHFMRHIQQEKQENEMWLEFNGTPLKWHFPIGVLLDLYGNDIQLPWNIVVHFDKFPENVLMHCQNKEVVEAYFLSCIKEADVLKHRGQVVSSMQKKDHNQLWLGLLNDKFDQFWAVNHRLMEPSSDEGFKYIPFRFYINDESYVQKLVKPLDEEGHRKTLKDLLNEVFPDKEEVRVRTHGIVPPLETPLQWLSEHFSYPDNFLHLCLMSS